MKKNSKKNRVEFVKKISEFLNGLDCLTDEVTKNGYYRTHKDNQYWTLKGIKGKCSVSLYRESEHEHCYSLFCKFDYLNDLTGQYNGKFNLHTGNANNELSEVVEVFKYHINRIIQELN